MIKTTEQKTQFFFNHWKKTVYQNRTYKLLSGRNGIDINAVSKTNYANLQQRLCTLHNLPWSLKEYLDKSVRDVNTGLTQQEMVLYKKLFSSEWYLLHKTTKSAIEKIESSERKEILSTHELYKQSTGPIYSSTFFIDEILDGIFFTISPGKTSGQKFFESDDEVRIEISLNEINPETLHGLFSSGCLHNLRGTKDAQNIINLHGVKTFITYQESFDPINGLIRVKHYCSEIEGEIHSYTVDRSQEIFTFPLLRQALCYLVIERIRHLGQSAWQKIYANIESISLEELQTLAQNILHISTIETHLPRAINIYQTGINIVRTIIVPIKPSLDNHQIISAAYTGNLEILKNTTTENLSSATDLIGEQLVDVFSAAILGMNIECIDYLLNCGLSINNGIKTPVFDDQQKLLYHETRDRNPIIIKTLSAIMGFSLKSNFTISIFPQLDITTKQQFALELLKKFLKIGDVNQQNKNITYPLHIKACHGMFLEDISLDFNKSFTEDSLSFEFIKILKQHMTISCFDVFNNTTTHDEHVFIFQGFDVKTNKSWYLLEYGQHPYIRGMFKTRSDYSILEPIKISICDSKISEQDLVLQVAAGYYALLPSSINLENTIVINKEKIYHIMITDPEQNRRIMDSFKEQIIFFDKLNTHVKLSTQTIELLRKSSPEDKTRSILSLTSARLLLI